MTDQEKIPETIQEAYDHLVGSIPPSMKLAYDEDLIRIAFESGAKFVCCDYDDPERMKKHAIDTGVIEG